jgi:hypothetical protein
VDKKNSNASSVDKKLRKDIDTPLFQRGAEAMNDLLFSATGTSLLNRKKANKQSTAQYELVNNSPAQIRRTLSFVEKGVDLDNSSNSSTPDSIKKKGKKE